MQELIDIKSYCESFKTIQDCVLAYLNESDEGNDENNLKNIFQNIDNQNLCTKPESFNEFLRMLLCISSYHCHTNNFYLKIFRILSEYKDYIKSNYTNEEIFSIFLHNEPIIILLSKGGIFQFDEDLINLINNADHLEQREYFNPAQPLEEKEEIQARGENHNKLCKIIRSDSAQDFFSFIEQNNISLESNIPISIFETNHFLRQHKITTIIQYAAISGSSEIVRSILEKKIDIMNQSIWEFAFEGQNPDIIEIVETLETPPPDDNYKSCLLNSIRGHQNDIYKMIREKYSKNSEFKENEEEDKNETDYEDKKPRFNTILKTAIQSFNFTIIASMIQEAKSDDDFNGIFQTASQVGFPTIVSKMMNISSVNINFCDQKTAFQKACETGDFYVVKNLIKNPQIMPNMESITRVFSLASDFDGLTALERAIRYGHNKIVEFLLQQKGSDEKILIDVNKESRWRGNTPLMIAAQYNNIKAADLLLKCDGIQVNARNQEGYTTKYNSHKGENDIVKFCGGETALHVACKLNRIEIVERLLERPEIDKSITNWENKTAVECTDNKEIIQLFDSHK